MTDRSTPKSEHTDFCWLMAVDVRFTEMGGSLDPGLARLEVGMCPNAHEIPPSGIATKPIYPIIWSIKKLKGIHLSLVMLLPCMFKSCIR